MKIRKLFISILVVAVIAASAFGFSRIKFDRARPQANKKICAANMKTIEGAVELYCMENGYRNGYFDLKMLVDKGYLKKKPECPAEPSNTYTIYRDDKIHVPYAAVFSEVTCPVHGDISKQDTEDASKGLDYGRSSEVFRLFSGGEGFDPLAFCILLIIVISFLWAVLEAILYLVKGKPESGEEN